jgi:hypothetical protein
MHPLMRNAYGWAGHYRTPTQEVLIGVGLASKPEFIPREIDMINKDILEQLLELAEHAPAGIGMLVKAGRITSDWANAPQRQKAYRGLASSPPGKAFLTRLKQVPPEELGERLTAILAADLAEHLTPRRPHWS